MFWFDRMFGWFSFGNAEDSSSSSVPGAQDDTCIINPATGLPVSGCGWVDVAGNPYGTDLQDSWTHSASWDSSSAPSNWDSGMGSGWDD